MSGEVGKDRLEWLSTPSRGEQAQAGVHGGRRNKGEVFCAAAAAFTDGIKAQSH